MYDAASHRTAERKRNIKNRELARQLVKWVFENFAFYDQQGTKLASQDALKLVAHRYLAHQARALVCCKSKVFREHLVRPPPKNCTPSRVTKAVEDLMLNGAYRDAYIEVMPMEIDTFAWTGPPYATERLTRFTPGMFLFKKSHLKTSRAHEMLQSGPER